MDEEKIKLVRTGQLCVRCRIKYRRLELAWIEKLAKGDASYEPLSEICAEAEAACHRMADLCISQGLTAVRFARECAKTLDRCVAECARVTDDRLDEFVKACRAAAGACRQLERN